MNSISLQLQRDEAFVAHIYLDQFGNPTIGYGHNLLARPISWIGGATILTRAQAIQILEDDIKETREALSKRLLWITELDEVREAVLINLSFNIGVSGLMKFKHMLAAMRIQAWDRAADEMRTSLWYSQVHARGVRLVEQMKTGIWQ